MKAFSAIFIDTNMHYYSRKSSAIRTTSFAIAEIPAGRRLIPGHVYY